MLWGDGGVVLDHGRGHAAGRTAGDAEGGGRHCGEWDCGIARVREVGLRDARVEVRACDVMSGSLPLVAALVSMEEG